MTKPLFSIRSNRREFLVGVVAGTTLGSGWCGQAAEAVEQQAFDLARRQAAWRPRRVIFNNDGDDIWAKGANTKDDFLAVRHTPLLGTHVDSIFYCTTQSFNHFTHQTKVAEIFRSKSGSFANNNLAGFLEQDTDGLRMSSEFARKNNLESIWTLRMNDIHDSHTPAFFPKWKQEDSTRIMSSKDKVQKFNDRRRLWSLVDFAHPDVQPRMLAIIKEVLRNYDVDGIELDFLRAPFYFRSAYEGKPATAKETATLSKLTTAIRSLVLSESKRKGKPLLMTARVPTSVALCQKIGIDIKAWLEAGLLDVMSLGGGYITFDVDVAAMINLGHGHSVPVYPSLSQSGLLYRPPRGKSAQQQPEAWFGAASRLWNDGADGIYTFNLFPGPGNDETRKYARTVLGKIGSHEELQRSNIMYAISDAGYWMPIHYWAKDAADFSKALPMAIKQDEYTATYMIVPEDLSDAGFGVTAELRVDFTGLKEDSQPTVLFGSANFGPQKGGKKIEGVRRFVCPVPVQSITKGRNRVMVKVKEAGAKLAGAELWIRRS